MVLPVLAFVFLTALFYFGSIFYRGMLGKQKRKFWSGVNDAVFFAALTFMLFWLIVSLF